MRNFKTVPCCFNCHYCEDASTTQWDEFVCRWYYDHLEPAPESVHVTQDGWCEYYKREESWPTN